MAYLCDDIPASLGCIIGSVMCDVHRVDEYVIGIPLNFGGVALDT
jgi:hypothetical protein